VPRLPDAGLLLIDKPESWTSHDVVAFLRGVLATRRVGHGGTLDPLATGLLVLLYGGATRLTRHLHDAPKSYLAEIVLGSETTTDDREGQPTLSADVPDLADERVRGALAAFVGAREQRPPAYSAIHVRGERSYAKARRGEAVELSARPIEIFDIRLLERSRTCLHVLVTCSAGTYVRALARDVGRALETRAHLGALRRIASGALFVDDAVQPQEARELAAAGALAPLVFAPDVAAIHLPGAILAEEAARRLLSGRVASVPDVVGSVRAYDTRGRFLGIADVDHGAAQPTTIIGREEGGNARGGAAS
jgi:tRNA pseudouridine55 synthase